MLVKIWNIFCIETFSIGFVYINSDLQKVYIIRTLYTICIQHSYRMNVQIFAGKLDPLFEHI